VTNKISIMGLFCEDIREEKNEIITLVGLMPDNVNVADAGAPQPGMRKIIPKVCVYLRLNFEPHQTLGVASVRLVMPNGEKVPLGAIDAALMEKSRLQALEKGNALAGVTFRAVMGGLFLGEAGKLKLEVDLDEETYLAAALNLTMVSTPSSASPPLSAQ
jgi:hypothetical protein